jgi:ornithine cyclodeaminase
VIDQTIACLAAGDFAQPLKPYLRFRDPASRIIAMPAFVGGAFDVAGLKWIASFPRNRARDLPRAHAMMILNDAGTGRPYAILESSRLSAIRTAAVSGAVLRRVATQRSYTDLVVGIAGFGPIGRAHAAMAAELLGARLREIRVYDPALDTTELGPKLVRVASWEDAYLDADVFVTCTVANARWIDRAPKPGSLHLAVSLRDYTTVALRHFRPALVVDDWDEVCREGTDVERFAWEEGFRRDEAIALVDFAQRLPAIDPMQSIHFDPMGLAAFDVALAQHVVTRATEAGLGRRLERAS